MSPEAYTRRQVLVDRRFQLKYAVGLAIGGASLCAAFGGAVWLALHQARETLGPESQATLQGTETTVLVLTAFMALVMSLVLSLVGLLVSHRVAGPMRVLRGQLRRLAEGGFPAGGRCGATTSSGMSSPSSTPPWTRSASVSTRSSPRSSRCWPPAAAPRAGRP